MKRLFFLAAGIFAYAYSFEQAYLGDTLFVKSVPFNTESVISIPCPNFEANFQTWLKLSMVTSKDTLTMLNSFIRKARYARKTNDIDVRAKFVYEKGNGTRTTICMSKFDILIDGRIIKYNKGFFVFMKGLATR